MRINMVYVLIPTSINSTTMQEDLYLLTERIPQ
uniref:Uncharacterized protein n=1 Tax=Anguilla anguilla TaxID=7936 RepID=A0A0E9PI43_ANGAN